MAIHCQVAAAAGSEKQNESLIQTPNCRHEKQNTLPCRSVRCWFANADIKRFALGFWGSFSNIKGVYSKKIQFNSQPSLLGHKSIFTQWCRCETDTSNLSGLVVWPATHHTQKDCDPKGSWSVLSVILLPTCRPTWPSVSKSREQEQNLLLAAWTEGCKQNNHTSNSDSFLSLSLCSLCCKEG